MADKESVACSKQLKQLRTLIPCFMMVMEYLLTAHTEGCSYSVTV